MTKPILALIGAAIGGAAGFFLTGWLERQGFYTVVLPGALIGFGSMFGKFRTVFGAIFLALAALVLIYFTEWKYFPFSKDQSLNYFVGHIGDLKTLTHVMAALGTAIAFWFPFRGRARGGS